MKRFAALLWLAACGGDADPKAEPTILLPSRDSGALADGGAPACNTQTDPNNCGACGNVCPAGPRGTPVCKAGTCALTCQSGFGDCNGAAADGCETDVTVAVDHCGACGRDCRTCGGSSCTASACDATTFTFASGPPIHLTVDSAHVTYADDSSISQVSIVDQTSEPVFTVSNTPALGTSGAQVLFVEPGTQGSAGIYATSPGFVGPQIAAYARGQNVDTFSLDDTGIYYAVSTEPNGPRQIVRCKSCTVPTVLSTNENQLRTGAIALDATTVFFGSGDMIRRVEKTSDGLKTIAIGQVPRNLQVDADAVYWLNESTVFSGAGNGEIARMPKAGGDVTKLVTGLSSPRALVVDGDSVYASVSGSVFRIAKDGTSRLELAQTSGAGPIAIDQTCVWFADGTAIKKVSR